MIDRGGGALEAEVGTAMMVDLAGCGEVMAAGARGGASVRRGIQMMDVLGGGMIDGALLLMHGETVRLQYVLNMLVIATTLKTTQTISYHSQKTSAILRSGP
jgi:hypothetical protein